jgi:hypothetical protein
MKVTYIGGPPFPLHSRILPVGVGHGRVKLTEEGKGVNLINCLI